MTNSFCTFYLQTGTEEWQTAAQFPPSKTLEHLTLRFSGERVTQGRAQSMASRVSVLQMVLCINDLGTKSAHVPFSDRTLCCRQAESADRDLNGPFVHRMFDLRGSSLEHLLHDISQHVQFTWHTLKVSIIALGKQYQHDELGSSGFWTFVQRMLGSALFIFNGTLQQQDTTVQSLTTLFKDDKNAYLMNEVPYGEEQVMLE